MGALFCSFPCSIMYWPTVISLTGQRNGLTDSRGPSHHVVSLVNYAARCQRLHVTWRDATRRERHLWHFGWWPPFSSLQPWSTARPNPANLAWWWQYREWVLHSFHGEVDAPGDIQERIISIPIISPDLATQNRASSDS